nr:hypothetical protein [Tanacetum cinerariifolium]
MILNTLDNLGKFEEKGDEGTKDASRQEVKKDVSSLRYIALSNWAHDALLKFSSSQPQDYCSTKVPEGSGNSNPTASTSNPPADQIETLTVETPIPTVKIPSLDNILSLTNWFEDILRGTTNSDESNGEEADIRNIEIAITASPTPTLRIHKDHPKSQIIGPVDTPIQTRNKSKEVGEQSFIATIHQKTDSALLQFCLFSCFLSQSEPKKIFDALQDPSWVEAMHEELLQFKIQNMDVKSAFLYGTIDEEVYAPRAWYGTLSKYLLKNGFQKGTIDQTLFIRKQREDFKLVQVYMDDIILGSSNPQLCREFEALMHENFQMSAMGKLNFFLGLQVPQKEDGIFLSQDNYVGDILKKFRYTYVRSSNTPMDKENPWRKDGTGKDTIVATSTTEAEYVAAASCCGQVLWIQNQLLDYG